MKKKNIRRFSILMITLALISCNAEKKLPRVVRQDEARAVALRYLGQMTRNSPHLGVDTSRLLFIQTMPFEEGYAVIFDDSFLSTKFFVDVDSFGNSEIYSEPFKDSLNREILRMH